MASWNIHRLLAGKKNAITEHNLAVLWRTKPGNTIEHRGLARAGASKQHKYLALCLKAAFEVVLL
jgi:hypothetical protein